MAHDPFYPNEKLWAGVHVLVTHRGAIRQRLVEAFHQGFGLVTGLDDELSAEFEPIYRQCTRIADEKLGSFAPTIGAMTEDEAVSIAQSLLTIAYKSESRVRAIIAGEVDE